MIPLLLEGMEPTEDVAELVVAPDDADCDVESEGMRLTPGRTRPDALVAGEGTKGAGAGADAGMGIGSDIWDRCFVGGVGCDPDAYWLFECELT